MSPKFCEVITGISGRAQEYTEKPFLAYIRNQGDLDGTDLPSQLARFALAATQESFSPAPFEYRLKTLEYNTYLLPIVQRAVFIMRYVLLLPELAISRVIGIPVSRVRVGSLNALLQLRNSLPRYLLPGGWV